METCRIHLTSYSITKSISHGCQKQLHESSSGLLQVGVVLRDGWVEWARRSRVSESKLNSVSVDEVECRVCEMAGVGVIVTGSRGGVEVSSWGNGVGALRDGRHSTSHAISNGLVDSEFGSGCVFSVTLTGTGGIGEDTTDRVVGRVHEVHVWILGLVLITSPAVENISSVGVEIDEIANLRVGIQYPLDGFGFWFGESGSSYNGQL